MNEKRFGSFENKQEMYDLLEKQAIIIEDLEKENEELKEYINKLSIMLEQSLHKQIKYKKQFKRIRNELNDCEKFRYQVFKRMGELI